MASPTIGFDRFIQADWAGVALAVRAGSAAPEEVEGILAAAGLSVAARKKTRTVLNRLWLEPRPDLAEFSSRGVALYAASRGANASVLSWGAGIATYPFFGKVAEFVGRLSALQGDCSAAEVHRRMSELYGEREGTYRMTNMVLQSQASWGAIERAEKGRRLIRRPPHRITDSGTVAWLVEAAVRYEGRPVGLSSLQSAPELFPFILDQPLAYVISTTRELELRAEGGASQQFVALRAAA